MLSSNQEPNNQSLPHDSNRYVHIIIGIAGVIGTATAGISPYVLTVAAMVFGTKKEEYENTDYSPCLAGGFVMSAYMLALLWSVLNQSKLPLSLRLDNNIGLSANTILAIGCCVSSTVVGELILRGKIDDTRLIGFTAIGASAASTTYATLFYCGSRKLCCPNAESHNDVIAPLIPTHIV